MSQISPQVSPGKVDAKIIHFIQVNFEYDIRILKYEIGITKC